MMHALAWSGGARALPGTCRQEDATTQNHGRKQALRERERQQYAGAQPPHRRGVHVRRVPPAGHFRTGSQLPFAPTCSSCVGCVCSVNTVLTFLSQTGVYGHTNAELSVKYQSLATPAGWAFAIWGVIFTSEAVYAVAQLLPCLRDSEEVKRAGPWFVLACLFQGGWSVAFGFAQIYLSQALILLILVSLWRMNTALQSVACTSPSGFGRYLLLRLPFTIHFGWLTAASAVSVNLTLVATKPSAHATLLTVALVSLTAIFLPALVNPSTARVGSDPGFALTIAWALAGVAAQNRAPIVDAPEAAPIQSWCPRFVTDALALVAATLCGVVILSVLVRGLLKAHAHCRARSVSGAQILSDALIVVPKP